MLAASLALGAAVLLAVFAIYAVAAHSGRSDGETRALGFASVVFGNLGLIVAYRARLRGVLATLAQPNPAFWWIVAGTLAALAAVIYLPAAAAIFRFSALASADLALAAAAALVALAAGSLLKRLTPP
jgi:Ca2+-transporting ATPase